MGFIVVGVLVLLLVGGFSNWNHSRNQGHYPNGILGMLVVAVVALLIADVLP